MSDIDVLNLSPNSFAIRYHVGEGIYEMDAFVQNKCAHEFLEFAKELAKILRIDVKINSVALSQGSVVQEFVTYVDSVIDVKVFGGFLMGLFSEALRTGIAKFIERLSEDKEMSRLLKEEKQLTNEYLKLQIENSKKLHTKQSNFFEASLQDEKISAISFCSGNDVNAQKTVLREQFVDFIVSSADSETEIIDNASIIIVSPVIVKTQGRKKPKWHGLYNDELISFSMLCKEFLVRAMTGLISFRYGCAIECKLIITRLINDEDEISRISYAVETVYNITEDNKVIVTSAGNRRSKDKKRHPEIQADSLPSLFAGIDD